MRAEPRFHQRRMSRLARLLVVCGAALLAAALAPSASLADSVALVWTAPGDDGSSGRASAYEMRYSENPVNADTVGWWASATSVGAIPAPLIAGSHESFIVAGLAPGKTFYFAIRASDEVPNVAGFSNIAVKQTTGGSVPLATPANFHGGASPGAILLTWDAVPTGGPELGYRLYRKESTDPSPSLLATLPLSATGWNDSTAAVGTSYDFSLATYDDTAEGTRVNVTVAMPGSAPHSADVVHGYPNPARDQVTFRLTISSTSEQRTRVTIFDLGGHRICLLADGVLQPGEHSLSWLCRSDVGNRVAPGVYNVIVDGPSGRAVTQVAIVP